MARRGLTGRVDALEQRASVGAMLPAIWLIADGESAEEAVARYADEHGQSEGMFLVWSIVDP